MGTADWTRRKTLVTVAGAAVAPVLGACRSKQASGPEQTQASVAAIASAPILRRIASRSAIDGQGATVQRVFPSPQLRHLDPFVLLDDFDVRAPAGFPEHPHRGFEAFTYMLEGRFHHRDTMGNDSIVGPGGTQRFNSGRGARHSEMPATEGSNRGLQLWVNLPRRLKSMEPEYAATDPEMTPVQTDTKQRVRTVIGPGSAVALHTQVDYLDVELLAEGTFTREIPTGRNTLLYVIAGQLRLDSQSVARGEGVLLGAGRLEVHGRPGTRFAYLSGRPHDEPILHRGPFVD